MHLPLVSFCFTTYKRQEYLRTTLESIRRQTLADFEVIVSDNDPDQSGRAVVEGMADKRFRYFANEQNLGMKKSFNKSLERSSGEYIVMIADDDPVYPEMLKTLVDLKNNYPGYGMYLGGCNWYCTTPDIAQLYKIKVGMNSCLANTEVDSVKVYSSEEFIADFFAYKIFPYYLWSTCMVQRSILVKTGGVPDYDTPFLGDFAYLSIMGSQAGCVTINRDLGHQTVHGQNFGRAQAEQIGIAAVNFVDYVSPRINHVANWPEVEKNLKGFVAMWVISHLAFLFNYYRTVPNTEVVDLRPYEKNIFSISFIRPFRLKYYLKKNMPGLHDRIVKIKKTIYG